MMMTTDDHVVIYIVIDLQQWWSAYFPFIFHYSGKKYFKNILSFPRYFPRFAHFAAKTEVKAKQPTFVEIYFLCNSHHLFPYNG